MEYVEDKLYKENGFLLSDKFDIDQKWSIDRNGTSVVDEYGRTIASCGSKSGITARKSRKNAQIISMAPNMVKFMVMAIKEIEKNFPVGHPVFEEEWYHSMRAIIIYLSHDDD